jgi:hypothetical protein
MALRAKRFIDLLRGLRVFVVKLPGDAASRSDGGRRDHKHRAAGLTPQNPSYANPLPQPPNRISAPELHAA